MVVAFSMMITLKNVLVIMDTPEPFVTSQTLHLAIWMVGVHLHVKTVVSVVLKLQLNATIANIPVQIQMETVSLVDSVNITNHP